MSDTPPIDAAAPALGTRAHLVAAALWPADDPRDPATDADAALDLVELLHQRYDVEVRATIDLVRRGAPAYECLLREGVSARIRTRATGETAPAAIAEAAGMLPASTGASAGRRSRRAMPETTSMG